MRIIRWGTGTAGRLHAWGFALLTAALAALILAPGADAAKFAGPVPEQEASGIRFDLRGKDDERKVRSFEFAASWECADGISRVHGTLARAIKVKRNGRFRGPSVVVSPDGATRASVAGRLLSRKRARGTLRVTGPDPGAIDDCDTGRIEWSAKRGRSGLPADPALEAPSADLAVSISG